MPDLQYVLDMKRLIKNPLQFILEQQTPVNITSTETKERNDSKGIVDVKVVDKKDDAGHQKTKSTGKLTSSTGVFSSKLSLTKQFHNILARIFKPRL